MRKRRWSGRKNGVAYPVAMTTRSASISPSPVTIITRFRTGRMSFTGDCS
jgi:hypothetical protein